MEVFILFSSRLRSSSYSNPGRENARAKFAASPSLKAKPKWAIFEHPPNRFASGYGYDSMPKLALKNGRHDDSWVGGLSKQWFGTTRCEALGFSFFVD